MRLLYRNLKKGSVVFKFVIAALVTLLTLTAYASKFDPSVFQVVPLNSPVKEDVAKFLVKTPPGFEIDKFMYKVKNAAHLFAKDKPHIPINLVAGPQGKELHIPVEKLPPGFYQLYVKVLDKKKKEHDFKTHYKNYAMFTIEEKGPIATPSAFLDQSIAGTDSDLDGIRDDVQLWLWQEYHDQPKVYYGLRQMAAALQTRLLNVSDRSNSIITIKKFLDSSICLKTLIGIDEEIRIRKQLEVKMLNNKERLQADLQASSNFNGQIYKLPKTDEDRKALCDFNINV